MLSQQLCNAQHATESVRNQLADVQSRLQDAEWARDHVEFCLEMLQMSGAKSVSHSHHGNHSARHHNSRNESIVAKRFTLMVEERFGGSWMKKI